MESGAFILGGFLAILIWIAMFLGIYAFMFWKVFQKAGQPGWASIVPVYNWVVLFQISGKPGWWVALILVPFGGLIVLVLSLIANIELAKKFNKTSGFAVGMWLLPIVFFPILGFGDAVYEEGNFEEELESFGTKEIDINRETDDSKLV